MEGIIPKEPNKFSHILINLFLLKADPFGRSGSSQACPSVFIPGDLMGQNLFFSLRKSSGLFDFCPLIFLIENILIRPTLQKI